MEKTYKVLARKYRPDNFDNLVGQEVLTRTLSNAITSGKIAQAFLLTGIRGIGKTTTARIIAKALNCIGENGQAEINPNPCQICSHCKMIAEDRHIDVIEIDAASHTGVDDIRDIINGSKYRPTQARYKIYIIDEVHMLSKSAFNALLKTLEEPPEYIKFIFATTELNKLPVTIVSRCQKFELKRLTDKDLTKHLGEICKKESINIEESALKIITNAAEGSVRDALSILDQMRSTCQNESDKIDDKTTRSMLGMSDRMNIVEIIEPIFAGDTASALAKFDEIYFNGIEPFSLFKDLSDFIHLISRIKITGTKINNIYFSEEEIQKAKAMAEKLQISSITAIWQILMKIINDIKSSPNIRISAEMGIIKLCYATNLPSPEALAETIIGNNSENKKLEKKAEKEVENPPKQSTENQNISTAEENKTEIRNKTNGEELISEIQNSFADTKVEIHN